MTTMEEPIDRGALFKYTQDYNLNAIVSSNFHWLRTVPETFFDIRDKNKYPARHYDRISISKSLKYSEILEIIVKYTPKIILIAKPILDEDNVPEISVDNLKLKNLSCFIYYGNLRMDFITKYLSNLKFLYSDSVSYSKNLPDKFKQTHLPNLELLCVNFANNDALTITAPKLEELNFYAWRSKNYNTLNAINNNVPENIPILTIDAFPQLKILRIDDNIKLNVSKSLNLKSLQFFFYKPKEKYVQSTGGGLDENRILQTYKGNFDSDYYINLLSFVKPTEVILPPNVFSRQIISTLRSYKIEKVGIYINDQHLIYYFEFFPNTLEIYDYENIHASMSIRNVDDLTKYISRTYTSIAPEFNDMVLGLQIESADVNNIVSDSINSNLSSSVKTNINIVCLTNFDLSDPHYNHKWMYTFNQIEVEYHTKPIIITRCEIIKPDREFMWPSYVWGVKKRVMIMNLQKQSLHLDISTTCTNSLIALLTNIDGSFPFKTAIIVTHGFALSHTNIEQIKANFSNAQITFQDVPYVLYS